MPANKFELSPSSEDASQLFVETLERAYERGEESGGSMDWNDVQEALAAAKKMFPGQADELLKLAGENEAIEAVFPVGHDPAAAELAAAKLILAYRNPENVSWDEVDLARSYLHDDEFNPKP
jgi:hypothetical protein